MEVALQTRAHHGAPGVTASATTSTGTRPTFLFVGPVRATRAEKLGARLCTKALPRMDSGRELSRGRQLNIMSSLNEVSFEKEPLSMPDWVSEEAPRPERLNLIPTPVGIADDISLHSPLKRLDRLGTSYSGVIMQWEGVVIDDCEKEQQMVWDSMATQRDLRRPLKPVLERAIRSHSVPKMVSNVLQWAVTEPEKSEIVDEFRRKFKVELTRAGKKRSILHGVRRFLKLLKMHGTPVVISASEPIENVIEILREEKLLHYFRNEEYDKERAQSDSEHIAPDAQKYRSSEPEYNIVANEHLDIGQRLEEGSFLLKRIPSRCIVVGNSNSSIEEAKALGMKAVGVATDRKQLAAADMAVQTLDSLVFANLKNLVSTPVEYEPDVQMEIDPEYDRPTRAQVEQKEEYDY